MCPPHRTIHARVERHPQLRIHGRRSHHLDETVYRDDPAGAEDGVRQPEGVQLSLRGVRTTAYTPANRLDDPRIVKLRELLEQATKLLDGANELVADLTEQLQRTAKDDKEPARARLPALFRTPR